MAKIPFIVLNPFAPATSALVMSTTPPPKPMLTMPPTLMWRKEAEGRKRKRGKGMPTGAGTGPGGGRSAEEEGVKGA
eukprot:scaffold23403_cov132-Isochrysis_galbana.AAC.4